MEAGPRPWTRLKLDVDVFEGRPVRGVLRRVKTTSVSLTTLSELDDSPAARRSLYELNKACSTDIPERGATLPLPTPQPSQ